MSKKDKENYKVLEQERNLLKITLDYYAKENEELKQNINDMKITVKANKDQLNEYVSTITNKDMVVEKMNNTIIQLKNRLEVLEEKQKAPNRKNQSNLHNFDKTGEKSGDNTRENTHGNNRNKLQINNNTKKISSNPTTTNNQNVITNQVKQDEVNFNAGNDQVNYIIEERAEDLNDLVTKKNIKNMKATFEKLLLYKEKLKSQIESLKEDMNSIQEKLATLKKLEESRHMNTININSFNTKFNFLENVNNKEQLVEFLSATNENEVIFMVDGFNRVWEMIMRRDISVYNLYEKKTIFSIKAQAYSSKPVEIDLWTADCDQEEINADDIELSRNSGFDLNRMEMNRSFNSNNAY